MASFLVICSVLAPMVSAIGMFRAFDRLRAVFNRSHETRVGPAMASDWKKEPAAPIREINGRVELGPVGVCERTETVQQENVALAGDRFQDSAKALGLREEIKRRQTETARRMQVLDAGGGRGVKAGGENGVGWRAAQNPSYAPLPSYATLHSVHPVAPLHGVQMSRPFDTCTNDTTLDHPTATLDAATATPDHPITDTHPDRSSFRAYQFDHEVSERLREFEAILPPVLLSFVSVAE